MSDDSFIREVEEELRSERMRNFWNRFGRFIIAGAIIVVLAVAGLRFYEWYTARQAAASGDVFMEAVRLAENGERDDAIARLRELEGDAGSTYSALARLRVAAELASSGKPDEAVAAYDAVIADGSVDENLRTIAALRAAFLLVDHGSVEDVEARAGKHAAPGEPFRATAREALALAHLKAGQLKQAHDYFDAILSDVESSGGIRQRATIALGVIASRGGPVRDPSAPAVEPAAAPEN